MGITEQQALAAFVRRLQLRSDLSDQEQGAIVALPGRAREVGAHREVVRPGDPTSQCCLVADGLLARFDQMLDGSRANTALHIPGDMCDLHSVVLPVAGWGIIALAKSVVVDVPHAALRQLAANFPAVALAFWRDTAADAAVLGKWVANLGRNDAPTRVAHLLCEMGRRMEDAKLGTRRRYRLHITQEQLGDTMGMTPVHVNRVLRILREARAADFQERYVEVFDLDRLMAIGQFDPAFLVREEAGRLNNPLHNQAAIGSTSALQ